MESTAGGTAPRGPPVYGVPDLQRRVAEIAAAGVAISDQPGETFSLQRLKVEAAANVDRQNASLHYGSYAAQPLPG
jgi:hypothetical protein